MKKVKEIPKFLSKIQNGRPSSNHLDSETLDKLVSNENFMDKLREATKMVIDAEYDDDFVVTSDNSEDTFPPVLLVKNNDLLKKMEQLVQMEKMMNSHLNGGVTNNDFQGEMQQLPRMQKLIAPKVSEINFGDFFPSKSERDDPQFLPILNPENSSKTKAVFPQSQSNVQDVRNDEIIFITQRTPGAEDEKLFNNFDFQPVSKSETSLKPVNQHVVSSKLVVEVGNLFSINHNIFSHSLRQQ